jgi:hypothetical protein
MTALEPRPHRTTWDVVIATADRLARSDIVCFERLPADGTESCLIINSDDLPPEVDVPREATTLGYEACLTSDQIKDVIANARLQVADPDLSTLYRAIGYYFVNDAFIDYRELGDHKLTTARRMTSDRIAQPRDIWEFYALLESMKQGLERAGLGVWAERLRDAVLGGATSGEILARVGVELRALISANVRLRPGLAVAVATADQFVDAALDPLAQANPGGRTAQATAVQIVVDLLVRREFEAIEAMTRGRRLTASDMETAIDGYGRRLVRPPESAWHEVDSVAIAEATPPASHVVVPLWTAEEGRSDLSLELRLTELDSSTLDVELLDIHVL